MSKTYSIRESQELVRAAAITRASIQTDIDAELKRYESALLRDLDNSEAFRESIHTLIDALMDNCVDIVNIVKNTKFI